MSQEPVSNFPGLADLHGFRSMSPAHHGCIAQRFGLEHKGSITCSQGDAVGALNYTRRDIKNGTRRLLEAVFGLDHAV
jgi:hypothetical protein